MSCKAPFLPAADYVNSTGYISGRFCSAATGTMCCLPCPLTDWVYPDNFSSLGTAADWVAVASTFCCVFLLISWLVLPVDKTNRHYLSICLTFGVLLMNLGFIIPLAAQPDQCADPITPNGMKSNSACAASGAFIVLGGWTAVVWVFLRSLSLHLQICWQVVVGRTFMWVAQFAGWGIPILGMILALVLSGVSFRFGSTCHINHKNSLAVLWIPLLTLSIITIIVQLVTFAYCIKVYLASLADNAASTGGSSGRPSYSNSIRTMTPRQAYRRVRRVIQLQWRGFAIVLIIVTDVVFFCVVFVFQDNTVAAVSRDPFKAEKWVVCLATHTDKNQCLQHAASFTVTEATIGAVLVLLAMNGFWLLFLLGRWSMVIGWMDLFTPAAQLNNKREFVSVDARMDDLKKDTRSYEMLSRDNSFSALEAGDPRTAITSTISSSSLFQKEHDPITSFSSSPIGAMSRAVPNSNSNSNTAMSAHRSPSVLSHHTPGFERVTPSLPPVALAKSGFDHDEAHDWPSPLLDLNFNSPSMGGAGLVHPVPSHGRYGSHGSFGHNTPSGSPVVATSNASNTNNTNSSVPSGRRTPDYFGHTARYHAPARSFSNPRPPTSSSSMNSPPGSGGRWDSRDSFGRRASPPLGGGSGSGSGSGVHTHSRFGSRNESQTHNANGGDDDYGDFGSRHPLGVNRI